MDETDWKEKNEVEVTNSFDRSRKYIRVLRKKEDKYFIGLNTVGRASDTADWYFSVQSFPKGGFYFVAKEHFDSFSDWGKKVCQVIVPDDAIIYKFTRSEWDRYENVIKIDMWRTNKIILLEPASSSAY